MNLPHEFVDAVEQLAKQLSDGYSLFLCVFFPGSPPHLIYRLNADDPLQDTDSYWFATAALEHALLRRYSAAARSKLHTDVHIAEALRHLEGLVKKFESRGLVCRCTIVSSSIDDEIYQFDQGLSKYVTFLPTREGEGLNLYVKDRLPPPPN